MDMFLDDVSKHSMSLTSWITVITTLYLTSLYLSFPPPLPTPSPHSLDDD